MIWGSRRLPRRAQDGLQEVLFRCFKKIRFFILFGLDFGSQMEPNMVLKKASNDEWIFDRFLEAPGGGAQVRGENRESARRPAWDPTLSLSFLLKAT